MGSILDANQHPRVPFYTYRTIFEDIEPIMVARGAPIYHLEMRGLKPIAWDSVAA